MRVALDGSVALNSVTARTDSLLKNSQSAWIQFDVFSIVTIGTKMSIERE